MTESTAFRSTNVETCKTALHVEPMRMNSGDCVIASIATALQRSYEDVAATLGIALDRSGIQLRSRGGGYV